MAVYSVGGRTSRVAATAAQQRYVIPPMTSPASELPSDHPVLGRLGYDEDSRDYTGVLTTRGRKVPFRVNRDDEGRFETAEAERSVSRAIRAPKWRRWSDS